MNEVDVAEDGFAAVGSAQDGTLKVGSVEVGPAQYCTLKVGSTEVGATEIGTTKLCTTKVCVTQVGNMFSFRSPTVPFRNTFRSSTQQPDGFFLVHGGHSTAEDRRSTNRRLKRSELPAFI